jgi:hypothetical protein
VQAIALVLLAAAALYYPLRRVDFSKEPVNEIVAAAALMVGVALLPSLWTYPGVSSIIDLAILLMTMVPIALAMTTAALIDRLRPALPRTKSSD